MNRLKVSVIIILLGLFSFTQNAFAAAWHVDVTASAGGDGSSDHPFKTIQAGINAASAGDNVWVSEGTYEENIVMKNGINLMPDYNEHPVIQGDGTGVVVQASGLDSSTRLSGFKIIGGHSTAGGGMEMRESSMHLINCSFHSNSAETGGAVLISGDSAEPLFISCFFFNNSAELNGGAVAVINGADAEFRDCYFSGNQAPNGGGVSQKQVELGYSLSSVSFDGCRFLSNHASLGGAVAIQVMFSVSTILESSFVNCRFEENIADLNGGGIDCAGSAIDVFISNSIFWKNTAGGNGNAIILQNSKTEILNSVFVQNSSDSGGSGLYASGTTSTYIGTGRYRIDNSIFYQNEPREIYEGAEGSIYAANNLIEGGFEGSGAFNINADPLFEDAVNGDFRLRSNSPCIDAGVNWTMMPHYDYANNDRIIDGDGDGESTVDMGAYEFVRPSYVYVNNSWASYPDGTVVGDGYIMGTDAFASIQDGIDAVAGPGRVIVQNGAYYEYLVLKTNVVVEAVEPAHLVGDESANHLVTITDCDSGETGLIGFRLYGGNDGYAGVMVSNSNVIIKSCSIFGHGRGIHMADSSGTISDCSIYNNLVGIRNESSGTCIKNSHIYENENRGIENFDCSPTIEYTVIDNHNGASADSGAAVKNVDSSPHIRYCTFENNRIGSESTPFGQGGAIYNDNSFPIFISCDFLSNLAQYGGAVYNGNYSEPHFSGCRFEGNYGENGGAVYTISTSPMLMSCEFLNNTAEVGGAFHSSGTGANPRLTNCVFSGNQSVKSGGALFAANLSVPRLINCVVWGNTAATGGTGNGGGIYETYTQPIVINSIIRNNTPSQIYDSSGETHATYSNIEGWTVGTGNIDADPFFVDPDADNFELEPSSPCIDTGVVEGGATIDMNNGPRPRGASTDIGVYEYAGGPVLEVLPDFADFGEVAVGDSMTIDLTVRNIGLDDINVSILSMSNTTHFDYVAFQPVSLPPGSEGIATLKFTPTATGYLTSQFTIQSNNLNGDVAIPLSGMGVMPPLLITATSTTGGSIDPSGGVTVAYGADQTFTMTADTGYGIDDVLVDGASVGAMDSYTFSGVTSDHTIEAVFKPLVFTITASVGNNGSISPDGDVDVTYGSSQTFTISPDTGYVVGDVVVDGTSQGPVDTFTFSSITADHTISVVFDTPHYFITATAGSGGTIAPSGSVRVEENQNRTFIITPDAWLDIEDVLVDGVSVGAVESYTFASVSADHTIEAGFADTIPDVWVDDDYTAGGVNDGHTWGTDAFASIQDGIDAVKSPAIVHVAAGGYNENIILKSGVQVLGAGPDVTIITGVGGTVVTAGSVDDTTVFEGFTVQKGTKTISGVMGTGMSLTDSSPVIRNCVIRGNSGEAMLNTNSSPTISDCEFIDNLGDGMYNRTGSNPVLTGCLFENNQFTGMLNYDSSPEINGCDFINNYVYNGASPSGGAIYNNSADPVITGCRFENNTLDNGAGGYNGGGGAMYNANASSPEISACEFVGNAAANGGAIFNIMSSPTITDCTFTTNNSDFDDDNYGGAIANSQGGTPVISGCVFTGNSSYKGGAISSTPGSTPVNPVIITNCIFNGNSAMRNGGALYFMESNGVNELHVVNSVFYGNDPDRDDDSFGYGGTLFNDRGVVTMVNTISRKNSGDAIYSNVDVTVRYSDIEGGFGDAADMNIDDDPLFMDPDTGNFKLRTGSPCIDKGTSSAGTVTLPAEDIEGTARPMGSSHDMGAYEYAAGQDIQVSAASVDFGDASVGTTLSRDITLTNTGDQNLQVTGISLSDDTHYAAGHPDLPFTIAPAQAVTLALTFTPEAVGTHDAELTITSDDPDESPLVMTLTGAGLPLIHTITAAAGSGGSISPSGSVQVVSGDDQAFSIVADTGYTVAGVMVDRVSMGAIDHYAFIDVAADHTIEAIFTADSDIPAINMADPGGNTGEDGTAITFTVVLGSKPSADVEIPLESSKPEEGEVSPTRLVFTPDNWFVPQTVTVTGKDDAVVDGDQVYLINIGPAESADTDYDGMSAPPIALFNLDDDEDVPDAPADTPDDGGGGGGGGCFISSIN